MRNTNKKGFTIVELVVVVAVIAILAAVLIPTFSGIIAKAQLTADQKAVKDMNTILATYVDGVDGIADAKIKLSENGIDAEDYKPLSKGYDFYFVQALNSIVLVDDKDNVVFPTNLKEKAVAEKDNWKSLSGKGDVTVANKVINAIGTTASLDGSYNLRGANINIKPDATTLVFGAVDGQNAVIENAVSDKGTPYNAAYIGTPYEDDWSDNVYGTGLIENVPAGTVVTVQNITLRDLVIGDTSKPDSAYAGIIAGSVSGTLIIKNVVIENCTVFGEYGVGALVGCVKVGGQVYVENVTIKNTTVQGCAQTAALFGMVVKPAAIKYKAADTVFVQNLVVERSEYNMTIGGYTDTITEEDGNKFVTATNGTKYAYITDNYAWVRESQNNWTSSSDDVGTYLEP